MSTLQATTSPDETKVSSDIHDKNEEKALINSKPVHTIDPTEAANSLGTFKETEPAAQRIALRSYQRRWIVLAVVALLNCLNTMIWISFAPISNHVSNFYGEDSAIYFSAVFIVVTIPVGLVAMWSSGRFGLKSSILIAAWTNGIGATIRLVSSFLPVHLRFWVGISGQAVAALAYPFIMFLPTKVAAVWFPDTERTLATTIGVMANPLGVLIANLLSPQIIKTCQDLVILNFALSIPSILLTAFASFIITQSKPKIPPTLSAAQKNYPFFRGVKECITNLQFVVLLFVMGGGIGMFNTLYTFMQKLLCPSGYSNTFSGTAAAMMIMGGVVGATGAGLFVDRTKLYEETMKVSMAIAVVFGLLFLQLVLHAGLDPWLLINCFVFGVFGLAAYPVGLQLSAECTFPVSETTSSGLVVISGQIQTIIFMALMKKTAAKERPAFTKIQVCTVLKAAEVEHLIVAPSTCGHGTLTEEPAVMAEDYSMSVVAMSIVAAVSVLVLILLFRPKLRRLAVETGGIRLVDTADKKEADAPAVDEADLEEIKPSAVEEHEEKQPIAAAVLAREEDEVP